MYVCNLLTHTHKDTYTQTHKHAQHTQTFTYTKEGMDVRPYVPKRHSSTVSFGHNLEALLNAFSAALNVDTLR